VVDRRLVLSGLLARDSFGPEPQVTPEGGYTQGMSGDVYVVRDPTSREA
jgi:hypothetical protein